MASGPQAPVAPGERTELLDVLRGVAILGILLVNAEMFFEPIFLPVAGIRWWHGPVDRIVESLVVFVAQAKFYALFSFLFGYGFALQSARAAARGASVAGFFARRLGWLLAIGLVHALLIWYGDILFLYAVLGFLLIPFRARRPLTLAIWVAVLLAIPILLQGVRFGAHEIGLALDARSTEERIFEQRASMIESVEEVRAAYSSGSFGEIFAARAGEWGIVVGFGLIGVGPQILALFIVGLAFGRARFFETLPERVPLLRRAFPVLLLLGTVGGSLQLAGARLDDPLTPSVLGLLASVAQTVLAPAMSAAYVCAIGLAWQSETWRPRLRALAPVGRMALTNYLTHSVVLTTLAYSYGLGLYGRVPPSVAVLLALAIYAVQVPISRLWLARFRFGPVEWLWRRLTYWGSGLGVRSKGQVSET